MPAGIVTLMHVVAVGGGHGLAATIEALGYDESIETDAFTSVADSGSLTGVLRGMAAEVGDKPYGFGDLRNNLGRASLNLGGKLFNMRFGEDANPGIVRSLNDDLRLATWHNHLPEDLADVALGDAVTYSELLAEQNNSLRGHTYGNVVLAGLASRHGLLRGMDIANRWLETKAHIQPITDMPHHLHMWDSGLVYHTEEVIDNRKVDDPERAYIWLDDGTDISGKAYECLASADIIVVAPGSLWTSTLPVLAVRGVAEAIQEQAARHGTSRLIVANLVHEINAGAMPLRTYRRKIEEITASRFGVIHNTAVEAIPAAYQALRAEDGDLEGEGFGAPLVSAKDITYDENDPLAYQRSGVAHDGPALADAILHAHQELVELSSRT
ncbi:MAG TPA: 2-phospho-L-lactate transferase CofD family protein [Candidatus Saccharimonadales bacterium]|nr:2-phospho-L-lactate transferase CofD family protein [Candidatus Saccharimonadales bacterium]